MEGGDKSAVGKRGASELIGRFAAYECLYCSVILTEREDLGLHNKSCPSPSCSMICLTCGDKFPTIPDMRQHLKFVHNQKTFGCKFCDMMFLSSSGLLSHTKAKHKPDAKTMCQICGQAFHNKANLEGHMNMHLGLRPFSCKKCGKSYGHSKSLMTHEKICSKSLFLRETKPVSAKQVHRINPETPRSRKANSNFLLTEDKGLSGAGRDFVDSDTYSFNEPYQPLCESKPLCTAGSSLQNEPNAGQSFPYNNSYQSLQTVNLTTVSDSSISDNGSGDAVYSQTSADFVMPQANYGVFSPGVLPTHR